jgi:hypothetical protein
MAYSEFTFLKLFTKYGIKQKSIHLFAETSIALVNPSSKLVDELKEGQEMPLYSEKAKSEAIIFPIIRELKRHNPTISVFSGYAFNIEDDKDLNGAPDFMISAKPNIIEPQSPIFCLVESKNKSPEDGFAQCAAEMYAARVFNEQMKEPYQTIYGTVTNAFDWVFLKLEGDTVYVDIDRYFLVDLAKILGTMQWIINQYK